MRIVTALPLFLSLAVHLLPAQSVTPGILTVTPQQCVWRAGDEQAWAAPNLDETGWQPYSQWKLNPDQSRIWIRCHADLSSLREVANPAIQASLWAAYQLYVDGALTGSVGSVRSGNFSMDTVRSFPLPPATLHLTTIALRITWRLAVLPPRNALPPRLELAVGTDSVLHGQRAARLLAQSAPQLPPAIGFSIVGVLGLIAFGFFLYDPSRRELFLLALYSICSACVNLEPFFAAALIAYPSAVYLAAGYFFALATGFTRPLFFFALARRRVPLAFWIPIALGVLLYIIPGICVFLPAAQALWLDFFNLRYLVSLHYLVRMAIATAPFFAFWPYSRITRRMQPLAGMCLLWGAADVTYFAVRAIALGGIPSISDLVSGWGPALSATRALVEFCAMAALFALLFREQRQIALDRAVLAGEMRAARAVQQVIVPEAIPSVPGFAIESIYKPAGEVGGDFFQILPTPAGGVLIAIGDISGKGMPAALTVSLLVGTVRTLARFTQSPSEILAEMNTRMLGRSQGGFTTCLILRADRDGSITAANAGHLAPYLNGSEIAMENGLPIGLTAEPTYPESLFEFAPNAQLTLFSDGVVEARNTAGELFGFDRASAISVQSAEQIASAAQSHGQEDDITVLTLTFVPVGVAHA